MDDNIIPRSNCIWKETVYVFRRATSYFMKRIITIIIIFSRIFSQIGRSDIGLYFLINCLSPFLKIGVTLACFHISGYIEVDRILKII